MNNTNNLFALLCLTLLILASACGPITSPSPTPIQTLESTEAATPTLKPSPAATSTVTSTDLPLQGTLRFFAHAESDRLTRTTPPAHEMLVKSSVIDIESIVHHPVILPTEAGLGERYPERVWGYGDITPFDLFEVTYAPTFHTVTSVYASFKWIPQAGTEVCALDNDRVFEHDWLTDIDYLCDCCVLIFIRQTNLQNVSMQTDAYLIGASASTQSVHIGDTSGELVVGHWVLQEETGQATTQTLHWSEDGEYGALRWQVCDWLFEIRSKGKDAGFTVEDLVPIAQDVHSQVVCE